MELFINGDTVTVQDTVQTVVELLEHFELDQKKAIVELNATILDKESYSKTKIQDGDRLEIVHFVGGG
ncbi:sulfur carrier protein ThiS [Aquibacillus sediminis]|uniref:sulfur carrier protein ThiS n=1 Tax=Aquibacillus sediminis TaxID=2574734 RepID=UPI0011085A79|nr:sulfur carrier protein ThiS [Aquibacillus sediminis]